MIANTQIRLAGGETAYLADLHLQRKGYRILSYSLTDKNIQHAFTYGVMKPEKQSVLIITLNTYEQIICTPEQAFYYTNGDLIQAKDLTAGARLLSAYTSPAMTIRSIEEKQDELDVYGLPVFLGENFILCSGGIVAKSA